MGAEDQAEQATTPRRWMGYTVLLLCDSCTRIQDGFSEQASEEKWTDQSSYFTKRNINASHVWWCHTICQRCCMQTK